MAPVTYYLSLLLDIGIKSVMSCLEFMGEKKEYVVQFSASALSKIKSMYYSWDSWIFWIYLPLILTGALINFLLFNKYCLLHTLVLEEQKKQNVYQKLSPPKLVQVKWKEIPGHEFVQRFDNSWKLSAYLSINTHVLVLFYVPWCEYCNQFLPFFVQAAALLDSLDQEEGILHGRLAAVNCDSNPLISQLHRVKSFPTIQYYRDGSYFTEYYDSRNVTNLIHFMKQITQPC